MHHLKPKSKKKAANFEPYDCAERLSSSSPFLLAFHGCISPEPQIVKIMVFKM